jgi:sodium-dependent phosphate cotransporter
VRRVNWKKIGLGLLSVFLFVLAIQLMKDGAGTIAPLVRGFFDIDNALNSLGFGWLSAYVILSGSPVAAAGLAFLHAGVLGRVQTFTMITGSRLGASFIVLFIGFIYVLRGHERLTGLSMGLLSFIITAFLHAPALIIGYLMLTYRVMDPIQVSGGAALTSVIDVVYGPIISLILENFPGWVAFVMGVGIILASFSLFDRALPHLSLERTEFGAIARVIYRPIVMFLMGLAVTLISMSVSISLSILVPLSARGYIRTENAIAYIMGANISTFIDTLLVALLLNDSVAFTVVLVQMVSIAIVSLAMLALLYAPYERVMLRLTSVTVGSNRNLIIFIVAILAVPIILMFV